MRRISQVGGITAIAILMLFGCPNVEAINLRLVSRVDSAMTSASASGDSMTPIVSADGRYILYSSAAGNLAASTNGEAFPPQFPAVLNAFLTDTIAGTNCLVSVNAAGASGGDGDSWPISISSNGRFVLFASDAANLIDNDTNNATDVFIRDLQEGATVLVSVAVGGGPGNRRSWDAVATPDGQFVAFVSAATNLVANDTNGIPDVFVRDLQAGTTTLVSVGARSTLSITFPSLSGSPAISADGRHVAYYSSATNLVPGVRRAGEVYVRDLVSNVTLLASTNARTLFQSVTGGTNAVSCSVNLSADGSYVAFQTVTNPLTARSARSIVLRHHLATGLTELVETNAFAPLGEYESMRSLDMTPDGRFIAFVANVSGVSGTNTAVYLWDAGEDARVLISASTNNALPAPAQCESPVVSTNGRFVAFFSTATGLVTNDLATGSEQHLYVRDVLSNTTLLLDANERSVGVGVGAASVPVMSADGGLVAFETAAPLIASDRNRAFDIYARRTADGATSLVSRALPSLPSLSPNGFTTLFGRQPISHNGQFVTFASLGDNLVDGDTNQAMDVFVHDLRTGSNSLVSMGNGGESGQASSFGPAISGNGRFIAFASYASNFFAGDTNKAADIFVRDLHLGTVTLASVNRLGTGGANADSHSPWLDYSGRHVFFRSTASDLVLGAGGVENLFQRDLESGITHRITSTSPSGLGAADMTPDGQFIAYCGPYGNNNGSIYVWDSTLGARVGTNTTIGYVQSICLSPDARWIACQTGLTPSVLLIDRLANTNRVVAVSAAYPIQFSADNRWLIYGSQSSSSKAYIYAYSLSTGTKIVVSHKAGEPGIEANGISRDSRISSDGRFIAYRSSATNLVPNDTNGVPDVFLYDTMTGQNRLLSVRGKQRSPSNNCSLSPVFSGDSRTLVFSSWASDMAANDFNGYGDIIAHELLHAVIVGAKSGVTLSWPGMAGESFRVESRDALNDESWQEVLAPITLDGYRAYLTDPSPASNHRFYRVVEEP